MVSDENHVSPDDFLKAPGENPLSLADYRVVLVENHVSPAQNHVVPGDVDVETGAVDGPKVSGNGCQHSEYRPPDGAGGELRLGHFIPT